MDTNMHNDGQFIICLNITGTGFSVDAYKKCEKK